MHITVLQKLCFCYVTAVCRLADSKKKNCNPNLKFDRKINTFCRLCILFNKAHAIAISHVILLKPFAIYWGKAQFIYQVAILVRRQRRDLLVFESTYCISSPPVYHLYKYYFVVLLLEFFFFSKRFSASFIIKFSCFLCTRRRFKYGK